MARTFLVAVAAFVAAFFWIAVTESRLGRDLERLRRCGGQ